MKDLIIDFNGTLCNTRKLQLSAWSGTFKSFKIDCEKFEFVELGINEGLSSYQIASLISNDSQIMSELVRSKRQNFISGFSGYRGLFKDEKQVLQVLSGQYRLSIISLFKISEIKNWLRDNELDHLFSGIYARLSASDNVSKDFLMENAMKETASKIVFIGDTICDYEIALKKQIKFVLFDGEQKNQERLKEFSCRTVFSYLELLGMLEV